MHHCYYLYNFVLPNLTTPIYMNKSILPALVFALLFVTLLNHNSAKAQTIDLLGGNVLNGALTGTFLGVGVMGLQNSDDFAPLRVGLGAGILGGTGIALYDVTTLPQGQQFFISGVFNDGNNSSIIILLDTMYGAGAGAVMGTAVMLIQNKPLIDGLQYGGSAGVWAGFGLGLIDAFLLAERNRDFTAANLLNRSSLIETSAGPLNIDIGTPALYSTIDFRGDSPGYALNPGVKLFSFSGRF